MRRRLLFLSLLLVWFFAGNSCLLLWENFTGVTLEEIKRSGKLKVVTAYNANSYFLYKGEAMGYEYELLKLLAKDLGVELEIHVTNNLDNLPYMLNSSDNHLIAANITVSRKRVKELDFTEHFVSTRQVVVQRKKGFTPNGVKSEFVGSAVELIGKKVYVRKKSAYYSRLNHLQNEIGGEVNVSIVPGNVITEDLIKSVNEGKISYTIADELTALTNQSYYKNLDVSVAVSFPQRIAWVVRKKSPELRDAVNEWISKIKKNGTLEKIYKKYYKSPKEVKEYQVEVAKKSQPKNWKISPFDGIIKNKAKSIGWDWRLIAAIIYQESRFNPRARSWAGALGLMQLMPSTGRRLGVRNFMDPYQNISAGVRHLKWLDGHWKKIKNRNERLKFVLASYNAGQGHVYDARRLAVYFGKNPNIWNGNVAPFILKLANPQYYNNYGVKYGYCRGEEPYNYVRKIVQKYRQYQRSVRR
ncbi:MAG: transporter substrate-binding domain-containing protein [Spirochaetota bacterium]